MSRQDSGIDNYIGIRYEGMFLSFEDIKQHPRFVAIKDKLEEIISYISIGQRANKSLPKLGRINGRVVVLNNTSYDDVTRKLCSEGLVLVETPDQPKTYTIEDCTGAFSERNESYLEEPEDYLNLLRQLTPPKDEEVLLQMVMRGVSSPVLPHLYPQR